MSYASAKGRAVARMSASSTPPPPLSDAEKALIAERARQVKADIPEAMDFIKALHAEGMVEGLRCIQSVTVYPGSNHGIEE